MKNAEYKTYFEPFIETYLNKHRLFVVKQSLRFSSDIKIFKTVKVPISNIILFVNHIKPEFITPDTYKYERIVLQFLWGKQILYINPLDYTINTSNLIYTMETAFEPLIQTF